MVDSALFAVRELMQKHLEALLYGQDVGGRLGEVEGVLLCVVWMG